MDNLALQLVRDPRQFQVIVTSNMFGDIVTDLAAGLQGGLGMAASGNIHPGRVSLFEPVHGSSPPLAGKNVANPMGAILTAGLMLDHLGWTEEAARSRRPCAGRWRATRPPPTSAAAWAPAKSATPSRPGCAASPRARGGCTQSRGSDSVVNSA